MEVNTLGPMKPIDDMFGVRYAMAMLCSIAGVLMLLWFIS